VVVQPPSLFLCPDHNPPCPVGESLEHAPPPPFALIPATPDVYDKPPVTGLMSALITVPPGQLGRTGTIEQKTNTRRS